MILYHVAAIIQIAKVNHVIVIDNGDFIWLYPASESLRDMEVFRQGLEDIRDPGRA